MQLYQQLLTQQPLVTQHTVTTQDILDFAKLTGDTNPIHIDERAAKQTRFDGIIAHGMLTASFLGGMIAQYALTGALNLKQAFEYKHPVRPGDTLTYSSVITAYNEYTCVIILFTTCINESNVIVMTAETHLMLPEED